MVSFMPGIANFFLKAKLSSGIIKKIIKFHPERNFPLMSKTSLNKAYSKLAKAEETTKPLKTIYLFNDEFTNYLESDIGIKSVMLLTRLGYKVKIVKSGESGRTWLSKGLLRTAKKHANKNIELFKDIISRNNFV